MNFVTNKNKLFTKIYNEENGKKSAEQARKGNVTKLTKTPHPIIRAVFTIILHSIPFGNKVANWQGKF